ncbi:unnamed protein product [Cylindrotheca closterium]|uniref:RRM domain-containing protein n=1 Tax=Cylindrotheca closterium TaxID=2856 RepID=A0AAD2CVR3_9STRA|nr:unnamed protein product [Cylindrotheca closterium]
MIASLLLWSRAPLLLFAYVLLQNVSADEISIEPTIQPTISTTFAPISSSGAPSNFPSASDVPSPSPSLSFPPSDLPSEYPTPEPTFANEVVSSASFRQRFIVGNGRKFFPTELGFIESLYIGSTANFATDHPDVELRVVSKCNVTDQVPGPKINRRFLLEKTSRNSLRRSLQQVEFVDVDFEMTYSSVYINVTDYPIFFQQYINRNNDTIVSKMQTLGLNVTQAQQAQRFVVITTEPTVAPGPIPTAMPTPLPSLSSPPSLQPSFNPTAIPSVLPTDLSSAPTTSPQAELNQDGPSTETIVIVVSVVIAGSIVLVGLLIYCRKRTLDRDRQFRSNTAQRKDGVLQQPPYSLPTEGHLSGINSNDFAGTHSLVKGDDEVDLLNESLISGQSLLSAGNSMDGDSHDEADPTHVLADEFDQYKDPHLERMRADVEGNLTGFDSMMSQALTRALIDDDDNVDPRELLWGGNGKLTGAEIEASALGEVTDWLKRKEHATLQEKRGFMQETLNKMVASVRQGVLGPDDASRTIHECAALLGLQLASEIPVTTLIVTGMRKNVSARDMIDTFCEFGQISEAAVAPNKRDFGILRFKTNQSVKRAMEKLRVGEIVVQDVAVHVKVLQSEVSLTSANSRELMNEDLEGSTL